MAQGFSWFDNVRLRFSLDRQLARGGKPPLSLRQFTDNTNWQNPSGAPSTLAPTDRAEPDLSYLNRMPAIQAKAITAIRDKLKPSKTARQMLAVADQGHVRFGFSVQGLGTGASYHFERRDVLFNSAYALLVELSARKFVASSAEHMAHELVHVGQHRQVTDIAQLGFSAETSPRDRLLLTRHLEAAAAAGSAQVAWELKQAGDDSVWRYGIERNYYRGVFQAFEAAAITDPRGVENGRARRAAHDAWFDSKDLVLAYDRQQLDQSRNILRQLSSRQTDRAIDSKTRQTMRQLGEARIADNVLMRFGQIVPGGSNHLAISGMDGPRADRYTAMPDPWVDDQLGVIERIMRDFRQGLRVTEAHIDEGFAAVRKRLQERFERDDAARDAHGADGDALRVGALKKWRDHKPAAALPPSRPMAMGK